MSDGIVHFSMTAGYVSGTNGLGQPIFSHRNNFQFWSNDLPAYVDVEIGVLEPATVKQFNALTGNVSVAANFLRDHVGKVHFFRERVPIRNYVNPYRAHEVP